MTIAQEFAESCDSQARWRETHALITKDERDARSAQAFRAAANWARMADDADDRLSAVLPGGVNFESGTLGEGASHAFASYSYYYPELLDQWLARVAREGRSDDRRTESTTHETVPASRTPPRRATHANRP
jgi:hypothetical protein